MLNFEDIQWETVMEAPGDEIEQEDDLSAGDYSEDVEINEVNDGELASEDYTDDDTENKDDENLNDGADQDVNDDTLDTENDNLGADENLDENQQDEQNDNSATDGTSDESSDESYLSKALLRDFIELYYRCEAIRERLVNNKIINGVFDPRIIQAKNNISKLSSVLHDYITTRYSNETYTKNLYQFNLIIQAMNINLELVKRHVDVVRGDDKKNRTNVVKINKTSK